MTEVAVSLGTGTARVHGYAGVLQKRESSQRSPLSATRASEKLEGQAQLDREQEIRAAELRRQKINMWTVWPLAVRHHDHHLPGHVDHPRVHAARGQELGAHGAHHPGGRSVPAGSSSSIPGAGCGAGVTDMNLLYATGIGASFLIASINTIWPEAGFGGSQATFFESAALLTGFIILGRYLEAITRGRTSESIRKLMKLQPKVARVLRDGTGGGRPGRRGARSATSILIRPGESVPVDGVVVEGYSAIDESMITGRVHARGEDCRAPRSSAARSTGPAPCASRPPRWAETRRCRRSSGWSRTPRPARRPSRRWPTWWPATSSWASTSWRWPCSCSGSSSATASSSRPRAASSSPLTTSSDMGVFGFSLLLSHLGAGHLLPLRRRSGDAERHDGRRRQGRGVRRAVQGRGGHREHLQDADHRLRQDGHHHQRRAGGHRRAAACSTGADAATGAAGLCGRRGAELGAPAGRGHRQRSAGPGLSMSRSPTEFDSVPGHGVQRHRRGAPVLLGNGKFMAERGVEASSPQDASLPNWPPRARPPCSSPSTATRPASWRSPTCSRTLPRQPSPGCTAWACVR